MSDVDPRKDPPPPEDVPGLLHQGAAEFNATRYWHAHEAWEEAWHALRAADREDEAHWVQGLILLSAALENLRRGKPTGFRRQAAEGLWRLRSNPGAGSVLGVEGEPHLARAFLDLYLDACRRTRLRDLDQVQVPVPTIQFNPPPSDGGAGPPVPASDLGEP